MLKLAMIFTDSMVLQREKEIPVWGWAAPGEEVTVSFDGCCVKVSADEEGSWKVVLPSHSAGTGYEMQVCCGVEKILLTDICVGEVWIAGGQSNMEYLLGFEKHFDEVLKKEKNPWIRFFDYPEVSYEEQLEDFDYRYTGFWRGCREEDLERYSAVGYYFAENLQKALSVPVGIVGCNWGGTPACAWMEADRLKGTEGEFWIQDYENALEGLDVEAYKAAFRKDPMNDRTNDLENPWSIHVVKIGLSLEEQREFMEKQEEQPPVIIGPYYERRPGGLYETMLKKVWPYALRGAIWYQGETDSDKNPEAYTTVFSKMIENWRELWGEEFPFLFVQLAPFGKWLGCDGLKYPVIRACQEKVSKTVPGTWMASIGDVGMQWDIHPKDKLPVGERLALLARGHVYGEALLCDAPEFCSVRREGSEAVISFAHADGLHINGDTLQALYGIRQSGEICALTQAEVRGETLVVQNCEEIEELQFANGDYYEVNLYNQAGIPVKPFIAILEK